MSIDNDVSAFPSEHRFTNPVAPLANSLSEVQWPDPWRPSVCHLESVSQLIGDS